jgi:hypothetical protein
MRTRLHGLKRLAVLYGAVEEMHSVDLQRKMSAVREAQREIGAQHEAARTARLHGREALTTGDRMGWTMAETLRKTAGWKRQRLEEIRLARESLSDQAKEQYVASRLKSEQIKSVVEGVRERMESEEQRRLQAASDDRFLARQRWTDQQKEQHADGQMKAS